MQSEPRRESGRSFFTISLRRARISRSGEIPLKTGVSPGRFPSPKYLSLGGIGFGGCSPRGYRGALSSCRFGEGTESRFGEGTESRGPERLILGMIGFHFDKLSATRGKTS